MLKIFPILLGLFFIYSCTGTYEKNMAELDEVMDDSPHKNLSKSKYRDCLQNRELVEKLCSISLINFDGLLGKGEGNVIYKSSINPYLWNASLEVTEKISA